MPTKGEKNFKYNDNQSCLLSAIFLARLIIYNTYTAIIIMFAWMNCVASNNLAKCSFAFIEGLCCMVAAPFKWL